MKRLMTCSCLVFWAITPVFGQVRHAVRKTVQIRGHQEDLYFISALSGPSRDVVLFVPGDGGWRGFGITIAETIASWNYDVFALDTKRYLESFTGKTTLNVTDVMTDFRNIAAEIRQDASERIFLVGWSEGAGLCLLAAAGKDNKAFFGGFVSLGLPEQNILGWHWTDITSYITKRLPNEPLFKSSDYIQSVSPLPIWMIQSNHDEYVPLGVGRRLYSDAHEPKRMSVVQSNNHRFEGGQPELFRMMKEALSWMAGANT